jgi:hypothetical protein
MSFKTRHSHPYLPIRGAAVTCPKGTRTFAEGVVRHSTPGGFVRGQPSWALSKDEADATHSVLIKTFSGYLLIYIM